MDPRPLFIANFKCNLIEPEVTIYLNQFKPLVFETERRAIAVAPAFTSIKTAAILTERSKVRIAAQDVFSGDHGAFTGAVSAKMLAAAGCRFVLVGHSERRQLFGEDDAQVRGKAAAALASRLIPVVCVGETAAQRLAGEAAQVVEAQLRKGLEGLPVGDDAQLDVAYEPIWAIGTGEVATPEQAEEMHCRIRSVLEDMYPGTVGRGIRILYGGSVNPDNAAALMGRREIGGVLVGGASLDPEKFASICNVEVAGETASMT